MARLIVSAVLAALLSGCAVGPRVERFAPAQKPSGVEASLKFLAGTSVTGELLEVENAALVILNGNEVTRVAYTAIRSGTFAQTGITIQERKPLSVTEREQLRLLSRFPQGLTPPLLASLLAAYRQTNIVAFPR